MIYLDRVIFEYSDGTKKYVDGEELEKWQKLNAIAAETASIQNINLDWKSIKWRKIGKEKHY